MTRQVLPVTARGFRWLRKSEPPTAERNMKPVYMYKEPDRYRALLDEVQHHIRQPTNIVLFYICIMRFATFALAALSVVVPALARGPSNHPHYYPQPHCPNKPKPGCCSYPKQYDHKDFHYTKEVSASGNTGSGYCPDRRPIPRNTDLVGELTVEFICHKLHCFADELERLYYEVKKIKCGHHQPHCYEPIVKHIYELEFQLDLFDSAIDQSDLNRCFNCGQEGQVACCYRRYADALIRLLILLADRLEYLDGYTAKYVITVVNSFRSADYTFVYELVRRMQCEEYQREMMKKQGALDGSTPYSIREAFALFVETPYIKGDDFKTCPNEQNFDRIAHKPHRPYKYRKDPEYYTRICKDRNYPKPCPEKPGNCCYEHCYNKPQCREKPVCPKEPECPFKTLPFP